MKARKAMKATKAMKAMKAMKKSKIASGRYSKSLVLRGLREKTVGGLGKSDVTKNKRGKVVSKKASALGKQRYQNIKGWTEAVRKARKELNVNGFVAVNGNSPQGRAISPRPRPSSPLEPAAPSEAHVVFLTPDAQ